MIFFHTWLDCFRSRSLLRPRTSKRGIMKGGLCPRTSLTLMLTPKGRSDCPPWTATRSMSPNMTRMELLMDLTRQSGATVTRRPARWSPDMVAGRDVTGLGGLTKVTSYNYIGFFLWVYILPLHLRSLVSLLSVERRFKAQRKTREKKSLFFFFSSLAFQAATGRCTPPTSWYFIED